MSLFRKNLLLASSLLAITQNSYSNCSNGNPADSEFQVMDSSGYCRKKSELSEKDLLLSSGVINDLNSPKGQTNGCLLKGLSSSSKNQDFEKFEKTSSQVLGNLENFDVEAFRKRYGAAHESAMACQSKQENARQISSALKQAQNGLQTVLALDSSSITDSVTSKIMNAIECGLSSNDGGQKDPNSRLKMKVKELIPPDSYKIAASHGIQGATSIALGITGLCTDVFTGGAGAVVTTAGLAPLSIGLEVMRQKAFDSERNRALIFTGTQAEIERSQSKLHSAMETVKVGIQQSYGTAANFLPVSLPIDIIPIPGLSEGMAIANGTKEIYGAITGYENGHESLYVLELVYKKAFDEEMKRKENDLQQLSKEAQKLASNPSLSPEEKNSARHVINCLCNGMARIDHLKAKGKLRFDRRLAYLKEKIELKQARRDLVKSLADAANVQYNNQSKVDIEAERKKLLSLLETNRQMELDLAKLEGRPLPKVVRFELPQDPKSLHQIAVDEIKKQAELEQKGNQALLGLAQKTKINVPEACARTAAQNAKDDGGSLSNSSSVGNAAQVKKPAVRREVPNQKLKPKN